MFKFIASHSFQFIFILYPKVYFNDDLLPFTMHENIKSMSFKLSKLFIQECYKL